MQAKHGGDHTTVKSKMDNVHLAVPSGNSHQASLRRLRKHNPTIHKQVISGKLSAHAGMIKAGLRKPSMSIPAEPEAVACALLRKFGDEEIETIIELLRAGLKP